jgi:1-acyl-sn-glycerol-3-phosphate acyltransferase
MAKTFHLYSSIEIMIATLFRSLKVLFITLGYALSYRIKVLFGSKVSFQTSAHEWAHSIVKHADISIEVFGKEHLSEKAVYIVNHRSSADIYVLLEIMPKESVFVYKHELLNHPLIGIALRMSPYIPVDRSSVKASAMSILKAKSTIQSGQSIIIFPEGTWSYPPHNILPFKQGSLLMASKTGVPIIPIAMVGTEIITRPDGLFIHSGKVKVHIGPPHLPESHGKDQAEYLRNIMQELMNGIQ